MEYEELLKEESIDRKTDKTKLQLHILEQTRKRGTLKAQYTAAIEAWKENGSLDLESLSQVTNFVAFLEDREKSLAVSEEDKENKQAADRARHKYNAKSNQELLKMKASKAAVGAPGRGNEENNGGKNRTGARR